MKNSTLPQRSTDSYQNLSHMMKGCMGEELVTWNNRLHLSDYKRSVSLQNPVLVPVKSDLLSPDFYQTLNAEGGTAWVFNHSMAIEGYDDQVMLSGCFDVLKKKGQALLKRIQHRN